MRKISNNSVIFSLKGVSRFLLSFILFSFLSTIALGQDKPAQKTKSTPKDKQAKPKVDAKVDSIVKPPATETIVKDETSKLINNRGWKTDAAIERELNKDRFPLSYEHIREDDVVFRQRIWREINIEEKINQTFRYKGEDENGSQLFISILLNALLDSTLKKADTLNNLVAFDASNDRFTRILNASEINQSLGIECKKVWSARKNDSVLTCSQFNPDDVKKILLKEEWIFDKEASKLIVRILGIAPIKTTFTVQKDNNGAIIDTLIEETPMFWVYYPGFRSHLAKYEVYNGKNFGASMSWEELFESRYFSSKIVKSTFDNPDNKYISELMKNEILSLLEAENIKDKLLKYEQSLWQY